MGKLKKSKNDKSKKEYAGNPNWAGDDWWVEEHNLIDMVYLLNI